MALNFSLEEYANRIQKTRRAMQAKGVDTLIVTDPSNMHWLSGYDGWSFYVHQCVVVSLTAAPLWFGRGIDAMGARITSYLAETDIIDYPDFYVQNPDHHPMIYLGKILKDRKLASGTVGVEMDNYYFSAAAYVALQTSLPNARFADATALVNWQRAVKSSAELTYMRKAGKIVEAMHKRIRETLQPGLPKNELVAEIYDAALRGVDGIAGDYPAIVPLLPSGAEAAASHLTWDEKPMKSGEGTFFEIAGCYKRYHCPLSRTAFLGKPDQKFIDAEKAVLEGLEAGLEQAKAGNTCEDIANGFFKVLRNHGIEKDSRTGYAIGLSYPPDWGERTMSLRNGDRTELKTGMAFHFMPGLWFDDWGLEITESFVITETAPELLANVPREVFVP